MSITLSIAHERVHERTVICRLFPQLRIDFYTNQNHNLNLCSSLCFGLVAQVWTIFMFEAPRKRTQHYWPTTPNIFGCYMLRPFALHVACCWELTCAKSETGQTIIISYVEMDATVLCLFARGLRTTASIPLSGKYIEKLLSLYLSA